LTRDSALRPPQQHREPPTLAELADRGFLTIREDASLFEVMTRLRGANVKVAIVRDGTANASGDSVRGLITKEQIANAVLDGVGLFSGEPDDDGYNRTANRGEGSSMRSAGSPRPRSRPVNDRVQARVQKTPSR
jgi:hypothetical protein